jgi:hypothetical protein
VQHLQIELCSYLLSSDIPKSLIKEKVSKVDLHSTVIDLLMTVSEQAVSMDMEQATDCSTLIKLC